MPSTRRPPVRARTHTPRRAAIAAAVSVTAAALALSACGSSGSTSAGSEGGGSTSAGNAKIAAVIKGLDNPFFQTMEQGIKEQSTSGGASTTVQAAASITDTTGQADKLTGLAGQDYSCYIVNPISGTNLVQGLAQLAAKKKTIVNIDSPIDAKAAKAAGATPATYIGTDNVQAGETAGKQMAKLLRKTGKVEVISVDGVKDALEAVKAGTLSATVAQYPYAIGLMGVEACQAAAKGKTLPADVKAPVELITKENATKALEVTPKPVAAYDDPFAALIK